MKNSQYVNSANINISEMVRLTFQEQVPPNNDMEHVITVSMHMNFLQELYRVIGDTLSRHMDTVKDLQHHKEVN